jgi:hypothetical protein
MKITASLAVYHTCPIMSSPHPHLTPVTRRVILCHAHYRPSTSDAAAQHNSSEEIQTCQAP